MQITPLIKCFNLSLREQDEIKNHLLSKVENQIVGTALDEVYDFMEESRYFQDVVFSVYTGQNNQQCLLLARPKSKVIDKFI